MPKWKNWEIDDDNIEYFQPIKKQKKVNDDGEEFKKSKKGKNSKRIPRVDKD